MCYSTKRAIKLLRHGCYNCDYPKRGEQNLEAMCDKVTKIVISKRESNYFRSVLSLTGESKICYVWRGLWNKKYAADIQNCDVKL